MHKHNSPQTLRELNRTQKFDAVVCTGVSDGEKKKKLSIKTERDDGDDQPSSFKDQV